MKRPKRAKVIVNKIMVFVNFVECPHCRTTLRGGIEDYIDRMRCWNCKNIIMLEWPKQALKEKE